MRYQVFTAFWVMNPEPMPPRRGMAREMIRGLATSVMTDDEGEAMSAFVKVWDGFSLFPVEERSLKLIAPLFLSLMPILPTPNLGVSRMILL